MIPSPVITTPTAADNDINIAAGESPFKESVEVFTLSDFPKMRRKLM